MIHIYGGHLGGIYTSDEVIDYDELYCETCGDSDELIATVQTGKDLLEAVCLMRNYYSYALDSIQEFLDIEFPEVGINLPADCKARPYHIVHDTEYPVHCDQFNVACEWFNGYICKDDISPYCKECDLNFEYELYRINPRSLLDEVVC